MQLSGKSITAAIILLCSPAYVCGERWVEYHFETWSYQSEKLNRKLTFSNYYYFDIDSLKRNSDGDTNVRLREVSQNDRFYVGKGAPAKEAVYKEVHVRCSVKRYEVLVEGDEAETHESMSEPITPGSMYERLFARVCKEG